MECPICLVDVKPKELERGTWRITYKCPNCNKKFKKKTGLSKGLGIAKNVALLGGTIFLGGDFGSDGNIDGNFSSD